MTLPTLKRLEELQEQIAALRERVAVLEARPLQHVNQPQWLQPWQPPFVVTSGTAKPSTWRDTVGQDFGKITYPPEVI